MRALILETFLTSITRQYLLMVQYIQAWESIYDQTSQKTHVLSVLASIGNALTLMKNNLFCSFHLKTSPASLPQRILVISSKSDSTIKDHLLTNNANICSQCCPSPRKLVDRLSLKTKKLLKLSYQQLLLSS